LWLFFLPSTFLVGVCIYIVLTLRKELKENILLPLQNEGKSEKLKIKEVKDLLDKQELAKQSESFKAKYKLAKQVAHDIRSPLSCLEVLAKNRMGQNNNETQLILKSIHRINEIAEDLLQNERTKIQTTNTTLPESIPAIKKSEVLGLKKINLSKLFLESVEFKKIEYSNNKDLKISGFIEPEISDLYFCLDPMIFQRVLSNLINNSVDAIPKTTKGFVSANLSKDEDQILIEIRDNGVGISSENLNTILDHGISLEKKQGNGLGLSHARQVVKDINGKVNIFSKVGMGTTVQICLPLNSSIT
jgi:signal transduction histidine kinase